MREVFLVSLGSFFGGGLRFLISKVTGLLVATPFPAGTFVVNILGCLLIGFFSGLPQANGTFWGLRPDTRLLLTTGLCGGFTTFSTFMKESNVLAGNHPLMLAAYIMLSLALGFVAVWGGLRLGQAIG
ncbi:MAG: CrcB family protein [Prevotella sp.]|jgi:CrcB protein|nr:CrcB family protein [Prevotella sp.]